MTYDSAVSDAEILALFFQLSPEAATKAVALMNLILRDTTKKEVNMVKKTGKKEVSEIAAEVV